MFNTFFIQPLFNALIFLYQYVAFQDLGAAIILLTVIIRVVLFPLFYKSFRNQTILQKLQPEIQKIQHDHKHDRERQAKAMLELYRHHKVNPFSGFLLILVQLPVLIALYHVFYTGLSDEALKNLYSFLSPPETLNHFFIGLIDLSSRSTIIVVLSAFFQYLQGRVSLPKNVDSSSQAARMAKQMVWLGPALTIAVLYTMPAAVGVYWLTTSLFSLVQQVYINKKVYGGNQIDNSKGSGTGGIQ